jgi:ABC-type phosphate/phosphonate transport system substrate-binding protein
MRAMISMYEMPEHTAAVQAWWAGLARHWRAAGLDDVPEHSRVPEDLYELWGAPDLFIAQTCGYPLTHDLKGKVTLVATPCYAAEGCAGSSYCSVIVVRGDSDIRSLDDVAGKVAAINGRDSQSGWHALRHSLIGRGAPGRILETGGHRRSMAAVREGRADVAAIDCVTYAGLQAAAPHETAPLRVLARSVSAPSLPFITRRDVPADDLRKLREGLVAAVADPALSDVRSTLLIDGIELLPEGAYDRILEIERAADGSTTQRLGD